MTKQKQLYCAPCTEVLVVQTEEALLTGSPIFGSKGSAGSNTEDDDFGGF